MIHSFQRPPLYPKQESAIFNDARYAVVEASTKSGKTYACIAWLFEQAAVHGGPGRHYWWIAPVLVQAKIAFRRLKLAIPRAFYSSSESELSITLVNGSTLWFRSGEQPDNLYGEDVYAAVIDEASRVKEEAWHAVRSTLSATRGPVRIIGNVKGRRNWAFSLGRRAEAGAPEMHYAKITADDAVVAGVLDAAEVEDARQTLPEHVFRELYLAEPADTLSLIYAPFGPEHVTEEAEYLPDHPIWIGYDWGFTDPTHIGLYQYRDGSLYQFDELVGSGVSERSWVLRIVKRICALPDYDGPDLDRWERIWQGREGWPHPWPSVWPQRCAGDPSAVQLRKELRAHGLGGMSPKKVRHPVESGQDVLRALILSGDDTCRFFIHPRCTQTREAFENYRATDLGDGEFDPRPATEASNHRYSHGTDQARYLVWATRRRFSIRDRGES